MYVENNFDSHTDGGQVFLGINYLWEKHWVYALVSHVADENLEHMKNLEWFSLGQLLGDDVWQFLLLRGEHESARRCFECMIEEEILPIKAVAKGFRGTHAYVVVEKKS